MTLDLASDETLSESMAALSAAVLDRISQAAANAESAARQRHILDSIGNVLAEQLGGQLGGEQSRTPIGVVFPAGAEAHNGWFLSSGGTVLFDDGTTDELDFGDIAETLGMAYGNVPSTYEVAVDLRTGRIVYDSAMSIHHRFAAPTTRPGTGN